MGAFGDKFRKERERRGFSLDDVSNVTKIGSRMLQAIEEEHFDQLPGGVFNKGFVRAYAKHLGFNDEEAVTEYLACLRQAQIDAQTVWQPELTPRARAAADRKPQVLATAPPASEIKPRRPQAKPPIVKSKPRDEELPDLQLPLADDVRRARRNPAETSAANFPWRIPAIVLAVIVVAGILWNRHSHGARAEVANAVHAGSESTAPAASPKTVNNSAGVRSPDAAPAKPTSMANSASQHPSSADDEDSDVSSRPALASSRAATVATKPPAFTLVIRAAENSWISVAADGQTVSEENLIAPAHTSIRATREIVVRAGNAGGVSFLLNGKEIPPQGSEGEAKILTFDSTGIRAPTPGQTSDPSH